MAVRRVEITLVRHGESVSNVTGRWQGQGDSPLSEHGTTQAEQLGERLAETSFDLVCSSDLTRAHDTGRRVAARWGTEPVTDPRWREIDVGVWEGLTRGEVAERFPEEIRRLGEGEPLPIGGGESWADLSKRGMGALRSLADRLQDGQRAIVFSHGGLIGMTVAGLFGLPYRKPRRMGNIVNTSMTTLRFDGDDVRLLQFNDSLHLGPEGSWATKQRKRGAAIVDLCSDESAPEFDLAAHVAVQSKSNAGQRVVVPAPAALIRRYANQLMDSDATDLSSGVTQVVSSDRGQTLAAYAKRM